MKVIISLFILLSFLTLSLPSSPACALEDMDFWQEVRGQWGQYATPENVTLLKSDVTCDGQKDYIGSYINLDNPEGPFFEILLLTDRDGDKYTEGQSIPFTGGSEQYGLCGTPGETPPPEVFAEKWDQKEMEKTFQMELCHIPISISDGMCDMVHFFWQDVPSEEGQHLIFFRN